MVPLKELTQWTPHHYFNEKERTWFTMENQGVLGPPATWEFSVLYVTIDAESADKAINNLNRTGYVLFEPPFTPLPLTKIIALMAPSSSYLESLETNSPSSLIKENPVGWHERRPSPPPTDIDNHA